MEVNVVHPDSAEQSKTIEAIYKAISKQIREGRTNCSKPAE